MSSCMNVVAGVTELCGGAELLALLFAWPCSQLDDTSFAWMMRVTNAVDGKIDYGKLLALRFVQALFTLQLARLPP